MATREENLKKINAELEMLSDEELDKVAGGTYLESGDDAKKFQALGVKIYESTFLGVPVLQRAEFTKLREAFNKYGVTIKDNGGIIKMNILSATKKFRVTMLGITSTHNLKNKKIL